MREQRLLVLEQQIVTGIELVFFRKAEVRTQQVGHRAVAEPLAVQPPFAAERSVDSWREPAGYDPPAFPSGSAAGGRPRTDRVEAPATTARPASRRPIAADAEDASRTGEAERRRHRRHRLTSILREQRQCPSTAGVLVEH